MVWPSDKLTGRRNAFRQGTLQPPSNHFDACSWVALGSIVAYSHEVMQSLLLGGLFLFMLLKQRCAGICLVTCLLGTESIPCSSVEPSFCQPTAIPVRVRGKELELPTELVVQVTISFSPTGVCVPILLMSQYGNQ